MQTTGKDGSRNDSITTLNGSLVPIIKGERYLLEMGERGACEGTYAGYYDEQPWDNHVTLESVTLHFEGQQYSYGGAFVSFPKTSITDIKAI